MHDVPSHDRVDPLPPGFPAGWDPDGPTGCAGVFGLPEYDTARVDAGLILHAAPFDATCSYRLGAAMGPAAIRQASGQIEMRDRLVGEAWRHGLFMEEWPDWEGSLLAAGRDAAHHDDAAGVERAARAVFDHVHARTADILLEGKVPGLLGGEHGVSLGAILACAEHERAAGRGPIGLVQFDAHMDLRPAFEGIELSHASVMREALRRGEGLISDLLQIGIRDHGRAEVEFAETDGRVRTIFGDEVDGLRHSPGDLSATLAAALEPMPEVLYLTFDIDAFDVALCPNTGTPVPGGLSWQDVTLMLGVLLNAGTRVVGFDLVEVSPGLDWRPGDIDTIDAIIGARLLYRLCGVALGSGFRP